MSEVDWDSKTVIGFKRQNASTAKKASELARRAGAVVSTDKKMASGGNKANQGTDHQKIAKLDRENEVAPPAKVSPTVGRAIMDGRAALQLSQKDLAQKINEKPSVLQDYESGRAVPNPAILGKMERILKVKLRGSDIGKPLDGPKKKA